MAGNVLGNTNGKGWDDWYVNCSVDILTDIRMTMTVSTPTPSYPILPHPILSYPILSNPIRSSLKTPHRTSPLPLFHLFHSLTNSFLPPSPYFSFYFIPHNSQPILSSSQTRKFLKGKYATEGQNTRNPSSLFWTIWRHANWWRRTFPGDTKILTRVPKKKENESSNAIENWAVMHRRWFYSSFWYRTICESRDPFPFFSSPLPPSLYFFSSSPLFFFVSFPPLLPFLLLFPHLQLEKCHISLIS